MAQPTSRSTLIDYCKRQLGAPVLEINIADEQTEDLLDDALQFYQERHYDGVIQTFLKYKVRQVDVDRSRGRGTSNQVGIVTTTTSATVAGISTTFTFEEDSNYIEMPNSVIGVNKLFHFDGANTVTNNMFSVKYQLFLNDVAFNLGYAGILNYAMTKRYLEDINFALTTEKQIRFNQRQDRLYMDMDFASMTVDDYLVIDCFRIVDPDDFTGVYNDYFLKRYLTALMKRQWGQNLIKFQGVKLPGGVELDGRAIYEDGMKDLKISNLDNSIKEFSFNERPLMGICLGMQIAIIEFSRNILGLKGANSSEFNEKTKYPVIGLVTEWTDASGKTEHRSQNSDLGGTMRLGGQACIIKKDSLSHKLYKTKKIIERHRHRYEVNPQYKDTLINNGMDIVGTSVDGKLTEMIEISKHPWFLGCQFHPEFTSNPRDGHPIFNDFIAKAIKIKR